jgi:hypothetical protein
MEDGIGVTQQRDPRCDAVLQLDRRASGHYFGAAWSRLVRYGQYQPRRRAPSGLSLPAVRISY